MPRRKNAHDNFVVRSVVVSVPETIYAANPRTFLAHVSLGIRLNNNAVVVVSAII